MKSPWHVCQRPQNTVAIFMKCSYLPCFEIKIPQTDKEPIETYTDEELRALLKKPDVSRT